MRLLSIRSYCGSKPGNRDWRAWLGRRFRTHGVWLVLLALATAAACAADLVVPTRDQVAWEDLEVGMFCHFGLNTFHNLEWSDGRLDPRSFNPTHLDADQWVRVALSLGAKYLMFTAKHHDGFCLWPTATTDYSVRNSPYQNGHGDVVGEVVAACRRHHLKVGLYLSPWDRHEARYKDKAAYDRFYARQLTELLTRYGKLVEIWFDGAGSEGRQYDWPTIIGAVKEYQPHAMIFNMGAPTIRWAGNEAGFAPDPNWDVVPADQTLQFAFGRGHTTGTGTVWLPAECDVPIRGGWFYHTDNEASLKSLDRLLDIYDKSVGRGANLLLNIAPDRDGLIPAADATRAREFGEAIGLRYGQPVCSAAGRGVALELRLRPPRAVEAAIIQEDLRRGQRVQAYEVNAWVKGGWVTVAHGTSIGHKKIDRFGPVQTDRLRLRLTETLAQPVIRRFAAFAAN
ncbi:MAG: alpha-L-fucosidase [Verrucomicrobia bacterium]|nr:alpha-L-fucosidase [Verrucomicrobiota bacterium]